MAQIPNEERKTLILTGASRGIGHATVKRFSSAGWRVITCSRHGFPEDCPWEAGPEDHIQVDLADPDNTLQAIAVMKERLKAQAGRLNALVNNAAISPKGEGGARLGSIETDHRDWITVFQVNFFAPIMLARGLLEAASGVRRRGQCQLDCRRACIPSLALHTPPQRLRLPRSPARWRQTLPAEFASTPSRLARSTRRSLSPSTETLIADIPCGGSGSPRRVAKAIYFLCTEQSSYINGAELSVDGGQHV
jgi:NAD(P)-dependent dehydrogenase (short-subunit alcohol dehydrogenase family)